LSIFTGIKDDLRHDVILRRKTVTFINLVTSIDGDLLQEGYHLRPHPRQQTLTICKMVSIEQEGCLFKKGHLQRKVEMMPLEN